MIGDGFPATRAHEGVWEGVYTHLNANAEIEDRHEARVICEFPAGSDVFYRQHIRFTWADGRRHEDVFEGYVRGAVIQYDTPRFYGKSWETEDGLVLLNLHRKDEPGASFFELIAMGDTGKHRARTWHWFRDGRLFRRTLCDESRIA